jgi:predicted RNase H-like HicB family nuclease
MYRGIELLFCIYFLFSLFTSYFEGSKMNHTTYLLIKSDNYECYLKNITYKEVSFMPAYSMIVSWSEDDQCYLVSVPDLPGCMADGATPDEAVDNVKKVIAEWIDTARELGRAIPEPTFYQSFTC